MLCFRCVPLQFLHSRHGPLTQLWRVSGVPALLVHEMQVEWREAELCDWTPESLTYWQPVGLLGSLAEVQLDTLIKTELIGLQAEV